MAKTAYQDKFMLNPDEISGSPVKKVDYEYTVEYEKLRDTLVPEVKNEESTVEEVDEEV